MNPNIYYYFYCGCWKILKFKWRDLEFRDYKRDRNKEKDRREGSHCLSPINLRDKKKISSHPHSARLTNQSHFRDTSSFYKSQTYKVNFQFLGPQNTICFVQCIKPSSCVLNFLPFSSACLWPTDLMLLVFLPNRETQYIYLKCWQIKQEESQKQRLHFTCVLHLSRRGSLLCM